MTRIISPQEASKMFDAMAKECAVIKNPAGIYPPYDIVPMAKKVMPPLKTIKAVVSDMDGTTTTTEGLCIHSLEYMVRQITGQMDVSQWPGLNPDTDYPHIIGNSTTRHVEYLLERYQTAIHLEEFKKAFLKAALWFLIKGQDDQRKIEVRRNLIALQCQPVFEVIESYRHDDLLDPQTIWKRTEKKLLTTCFKGITFFTETQKVKMAVDIYYQRYHEILSAIDHHEKIPYMSTVESLIEPMPGIGIYLALMKGFLGDEILSLLPILKNEYEQKSGKPFLEQESLEDKLLYISTYFEKHPIKIAIVTSSIFYEARIVMNHVFERLNHQMREWPLSEIRKKHLLSAFSTYYSIYDAFVTASDSNEIRLKPHRDLYSIALHQLGISSEDFETVVGFEDSESGTIALRAAGIGLCCAVPFHETKGHNLSAASLILLGGIPEVILKQYAFLTFED